MSELNIINNIDEMRSNETYKKASAICEKHGYVLSIFVNNKYENDEMKTVSIRPNGNVKYLPDVIYNSESGFCIDTLANGFLTMDEYPEFMKANEQAFEMVTELKAIPENEWPCIVKY